MKVHEKVVLLASTITVYGYGCSSIASRGELYFDDTERTFDEAEENCVSMGGHLVSIQNEGENIEIDNFIARSLSEREIGGTFVCLLYYGSKPGCMPFQLYITMYRYIKFYHLTTKYWGGV